MDEEIEKEAGPKATSGRKLLVVKKRKKVAPKKAASGVLPKFKHRSTTAAAAASTATAPPQINDNHDDDDDQVKDAFDAALAELPSDCLLAMQSLQSNPLTRLAVPLPADAKGRYIYGILELHLHRQLDSSGESSRELAELLATNQLRKLSSPSTEQHPVQVLVSTADYEWAARTTIHDNSAAVDWMMRQLPHLTGHKLTLADWQHQWRNDPVPGTRLDVILDALSQRHQLLLFLPLEQAYQLWLPTWGVVLQAWETARKKALAHVRRSTYKERSLQAMQKVSSPIPTEMLLDWMESVGQLEWIPRPASKYVRLPAHDNES